MLLCVLFLKLILFYSCLIWSLLFYWIDLFSSFFLLFCSSLNSYGSFCNPWFWFVLWCFFSFLLCAVFSVDIWCFFLLDFAIYVFSALMFYFIFVNNYFNVLFYLCCVLPFLSFGFLFFVVFFVFFFSLVSIGFSGWFVSFLFIYLFFLYSFVFPCRVDYTPSKMCCE